MYSKILVYLLWLSWLGVVSELVVGEFCCLVWVIEVVVFDVGHNRTLPNLLDLSSSRSAFMKWLGPIAKSRSSNLLFAASRDPLPTINLFCLEHLAIFEAGLR